MLIPSDQDTLRLVWARGGTSKGLYLHAQDLPPAGPQRDALLCRLMGSPDLNQIDGLGGGKPVTSKLAIIGPSTRQDADVPSILTDEVRGSQPRRRLAGKGDSDGFVVACRSKSQQNRGAPLASSPLAVSVWYPRRGLSGLNVVVIQVRFCGRVDSDDLAGELV